MCSVKRMFRENLESFFTGLKPDPSSPDRMVRVLAAVSGGADSVFLLVMLHECSVRFGFSTAAVTVDHRIRPPEESGGDADFVERLCASLSPKVPCFRVNLAEGAVASEAKKRGMGVEEAARFLRYRAFSATAESWGADVVMTGHTLSDHVETVVMRFLQGAGFSKSTGIDVGRGLFFRPMRSLSGEDVRAFLRSEGIPWREDSSNASCAFLRNKIRIKLLPLLDREFPGWRKAVVCGAEKSSMDSHALEGLPLPEWEKCASPPPLGFYLACSADEYTSLAPALRLRFLYRGLSALGVQKRVPYRLLRAMVFGSSADAFFQGGAKNEAASYAKIFKTGFSVCGCGFFFEAGRRRIFFGRDIVHNRKNGYLVYVRSSGFVPLPFGSVKVVSAPETGDVVAVGKGREIVCALPAVIRSRSPDDTVRAADGSRRSLKKIFSGWGVPAFQRCLIPVVEVSGEIAAVLGSFLGFPDCFSGR